MKLTAMFLILFLIPFLAMAALWYAKSVQSIEENTIQSTEQLVLQITRNVDYYFNDVKKWTAPLLTNSIVQDFIRLEPEKTYRQYEVASSIELELFRNYVYGRNDIAGVTLLSSTGNYITNTVVRDRLPDYIRMLDEEESYRILGITNLNANPVLTIYRKVVDTRSYLTGGAVIVDLRLNPILDIVGRVQLGEGGIVSLADPSGRYLYHPDHGQWGKPVPGTIVDRLADRDQTHFITGSGSGRIIVIAHRSKETDMTLIAEVPLKGLTKPITEIRNWTILLIGFILALAVVLFIGFSWSINRPLHDLMRRMKKAELGNLHIRAPARKDEFGRLNEGFNRMIGEIQRLVEIVHYAELREREMTIRQKESVLASLQAKINPHFLYNTLETIQAHAIVAKVRPIQNIAVWLSQILRYSLGNHDKVVLLETEMNHVFAYFNIQKERFRELQVEVNLDPRWLNSVQILPLTIQPIVENVFSHAYSHRNIDYVGLHASNEAEYFSLRVVDRGSGMDPHLVERYNDAFANWTEKALLQTEDRPFQRLGLWNVHSRLRLAFGRPYGLSIVRSDEEGTIVEIKLPYTS
jgi:two-component system sensor histidine kinase YesM